MTHLRVLLADSILDLFHHDPAEMKAHDLRCRSRMNTQESSPANRVPRGKGFSCIVLIPQPVVLCLNKLFELSLSNCLLAALFRLRRVRPLDGWRHCQIA